MMNSKTQSHRLPDDITNLLKQEIFLYENMQNNNYFRSESFGEDIFESMRIQIDQCLDKKKVIKEEKNDLLGRVSQVNNELLSWQTVFKKTKREYELLDGLLWSKIQMNISTHTAEILKERPTHTQFYYIISKDSVKELQNKINDLHSCLSDSEIVLNQLLSDYERLKEDKKKAEDKIRCLNLDNKSRRYDNNTMKRKISSYQDAFGGIIDIVVSKKGNPLIDSICEVLVEYGLHKKGKEITSSLKNIIVESEGNSDSVDQFINSDDYKELRP